MVAVLETEGLTRRFGRILAVDGLNLRVEEGDVYGFLGLNGAGKTTTIRMCLQLIRPTAGRVRIFGQDLRTSFISIMSQIGALVELPAYYPHLSARTNLEILRIMSPGIEPARIDHVLELVGLAARGDSAVRTYSQGMRQRLGIAMALLPRPRLVMLDEPTNGLDPQGIADIRAVLKDLNRRDGVTLLISSHLLHEVEVTCTRVGILKSGKLIEQESVEAILAKAGTSVRIQADPAPRALEVVRAIPYVQGAASDGDGTVTVRVAPERRAELNAELVKAGIKVSGFIPEQMTLESYFLSR
ncbi:MAG TPA: ABC transporter ATP-binding protein [Planctomycetota bacterium]|nr:ABC transporter ATP-binding protein [Planctomycetota bacterium]